MNLFEAYQGPFSKWLGPLENWKPWIPVIKSLSGLPLAPEEMELFSKCTARTKPFDKKVQEAWLIVGRRGKKSAIAATIAVHTAVFYDWSQCLAPGETGRVLVIAVTKDQAKIVRSYCEAILRSHPDLEALITGLDSESISLSNGLTILCATNSFRSIRGPAVVCAIFEECAFWRSEESATPDKEVLRAVLPAMLTTKKAGALLIGISSPYAKKGLLWEKYREHSGQDESTVLVWKADTFTMNPQADPAEIEAGYKDDPAGAAAEFGGNFRSDVSGFLDAELLATLTRVTPLELPPQDKIKYVAFIDAAGGTGQDSYSLGIGHREEKEGNIVLDLARECIPPFDPAVVTADFAALLKQYRIREVIGDAFSGGWVRTEWEKVGGIKYKVSPLTKSQIYMESLPLFTRGQVQLPDHRKLLIQLGSLERRTQRGGKDSVDHPAGKSFHDDLANAACGALFNTSLFQKKKTIGAWMGGWAPSSNDVYGAGSSSSRYSNGPNTDEDSARYGDSGNSPGPGDFSYQ